MRYFATKQFVSTTTLHLRRGFCTLVLFINAVVVKNYQVAEKWQSTVYCTVLCREPNNYNYMCVFMRMSTKFEPSSLYIPRIRSNREKMLKLISVLCRDSDKHSR